MLLMLVLVIVIVMVIKAWSNIHNGSYDDENGNNSQINYEMVRINQYCNDNQSDNNHQQNINNNPKIRKNNNVNNSNDCDC